MESDLFKQLEDKKKGCGKTFNNLICGESYDSSYNPTRFLYCQTCQAEITILEQAIAEIQKRDKEEIEWIEGKIKLFKEIHSLSGIHIELGFLDRIEQLQSQQNPSQASEGVKIEASHNQHRTPKVVNVEEIQRDVNLTSTNLSADTPQGEIAISNPVVSNLLQKQRQEEITWLVSLNHDLKECNIKNIYPTEGYRIDEWIKKRIEQLNQPKTEE